MEDSRNLAPELGRLSGVVLDREPGLLKLGLGRLARSGGRKQATAGGGADSGTERGEHDGQCVRVQRGGRGLSGWGRANRRRRGRLASVRKKAGLYSLFVFSIQPRDIRLAPNCRATQSDCRTTASTVRSHALALLFVRILVRHIVALLFPEPIQRLRRRVIALFFHVPSQRTSEFGIKRKSTACTQCCKVWRIPGETSSSFGSTKAVCRKGESAASQYSRRTSIGRQTRQSSGQRHGIGAGTGTGDSQTPFCRYFCNRILRHRPLASPATRSHRPTCRTSSSHLRPRKN